MRENSEGDFVVNVSTAAPANGYNFGDTQSASLRVPLRSFLHSYRKSMPLLGAEIDQWPNGLIESEAAFGQQWWAMYTMARQEKKLMRMLVDLQVNFYSPVIERRYRAPNGRLRKAYDPLFPNYVFVHGDELKRYQTVCTGCVSRWIEVEDNQALVTDLRQIHQLILTGEPLAPEEKITAGQKVRVKSGIFKGFEGVVVRRENSVRLLIYVRYMGRGASVALDDCQLEVID